MQDTHHHQSVYCDAAQVGHVQSAIFLNLLRVMDQKGNAALLGSFVLTPLVAKRVMRALETQIRKYESEFGHISDPEVIVPAAMMPKAG